MAEYSNAEYYDMIMCVGASEGILTAARELYRQRHIDGRELENQRRLPSYACFRRLVNRLHSNGSFHSPNSEGRSSDRADARVEQNILDHFAEDPTRSTRKASVVLGVSRMKVWRTLKKDNQHAYHYQRTQQLTEADFLLRLRFCEWYRSQVTADPMFSSRVLWSDEATFTRFGLSNSHNEHYWSHENPHAFRQSHFQHRWKINVWAGIIGDKLIGPVFLPDRLNGEIYLEMLRTTLEEELEGLPLLVYRDMIFQQDGAPAHYTRSVREYLDDRFHAWIGRSGTVPWPPRSPDLTPMDFFLWGYLKSVVYATQCETVNDMRQKIVEACGTLTPEYLSRATQSVSRRVNLCVTRGGQHIEPFL